MNNKVNCPFCNIDEVGFVESDKFAFAFRDEYPVTDLHTLVVPEDM